VRPLGRNGLKGGLVAIEIIALARDGTQRIIVAVYSYIVLRKRDTDDFVLFREVYNGQVLLDNTISA
jgi:hypothetical protein